jgi:hypothetical protein
MIRSSFTGLALIEPSLTEEARRAAHPRNRYPAPRTVSITAGSSFLRR